MIKYLADARGVLVALLLALAAPCAFAQSTGRSDQGNSTQAGDPDLGLIIILGLIAFFVLLAWLISRMGDDGGRGPDHTML
jgi:hypothetical protein